MKTLSTPFLIVGIVGIAFLVAGFWSASSLPLVENQAPQTGAGLPVRLKIPSISIDASVEYVGVTSTGAMGAPKSPANVAWYELGPRPGDVGSAALSGHYGWRDNLPAVFDDIDSLRKGDKIYVEDAEGVITTFVVRELRSYDQDADAREVFHSNDGKAHLNLITCEGVWDTVAETYDKRLVVFADEE